MSNSKSSTKTLTWRHYVHFLFCLCIPLSLSLSLFFIILSLIFTFAFCFVPPNLSLHLSNKHKHTQFIYHPNLHSLFINELLTKSQNYLTLMGHLFSPTLPLSHHTCLLKYLCWLPGNIYVTELPFAMSFPVSMKASKTALIIWLRRHPVDGVGITINLSHWLRMKFN